MYVKGIHDGASPRSRPPRLLGSLLSHSVFLKYSADCYNIACYAITLL